MSILIIDDSVTVRTILKTELTKEGFREIILVNSASSALEEFLRRTPEFDNIDLILLDIIMPGMDGIEFTGRLKRNERFDDIPIIIITSKGDIKNLEKAFKAGATDFIEKPFHRIELIARVRSAITLKREMDKRKKREHELIERERELLEINRLLELANQSYLKSSAMDGLTGIPNRRYFDQYLEMEWDKAVKIPKVLSIIMIDIDYFKGYNDNYGHQAGDDCLVKIATTLKNALTQSTDMLARYGGEEFVALLPGIKIDDARSIALQMKEKVENLRIKHEYSKVAPHVTISAGVADDIPKTRGEWGTLIKKADNRLYEAKKDGRNRVI